MLNLGVSYIGASVLERILSLVVLTSSHLDYLRSGDTPEEGSEYVRASGSNWEATTDSTALVIRVVVVEFVLTTWQVLVVHYVVFV